MGHKGFKMFSPERAALLLLAAALCAWATVRMCSRGPDSSSLNIVAPDTVTQAADSNVIVVKREKAKQRQSGKKKSGHGKKEKKPVNHRDHLNEPVPTF